MPWIPEAVLPPSLPPPTGAESAHHPVHALALLLSGRCRRCAERLPGGTALRAGPCPACGAATGHTSADRLLVDQLFRERAAQRIWIGAALAAAATFIAGALPLVSSAILAVAAVWVSLTIVRPAARLLSVRRRLVALWTWRLGAGIYVALNVIAIELLTLVPIIGIGAKAVGAALNVAALGVLARRYFGWQTHREARGTAVALREYIGIGLAAIAIIGGSIAAFSAAAWVLSRLVGVVAKLQAGVPL